MEEIEGRLVSLAQKASSTVRAVRLRAYRNLLSKSTLSSSIPMSDLPTGVEHYEFVLEAVEQSLRRAVAHSCTAEDIGEALLACELCTTISKVCNTSGIELPR